MSLTRNGEVRVTIIRSKSRSRQSGSCAVFQRHASTTRKRTFTRNIAWVIIGSNDRMYGKSFHILMARGTVVSLICFAFNWQYNLAYGVKLSCHSSAVHLAGSALLLMERICR